MKICYVANSRFPSERAHMTQIVQMCNAFAAGGDDVTLLVTDRKTQVADSPEVFFGVPINFEIVRIPVPDIAGISPRIPILLRPFFFSLQRIVFALRAAAYVRRTCPDAYVYGRDEWILWMLSKFVRAPIVWESHEARFSFAARRLLSRIQQFVVISEGIHDFYIRQGILSERMLVAHDAVDSRFFGERISTEHARELLGIETKKPVALYIGGLEEWKGARTFFEAARRQDFFDTYVVGGKETELEHFRGEYPSVNFLGPRPYRDLPKVQQAADVLVVPNTAMTPLSAEYTSPLKLFAHMTSGKPIAASRIPSITNVLGEDEAFLFTPDNPEDLIRAIREALEENTLAHERAERAYKKSSRYTWEKRAGEIRRFMDASR